MDLPYEERREGVMRKNETFYGFVWMDTNDIVQIQPVNPVTFSYDFYGEQRTVVSLEELTQYDGEMRGLYRNE